jgi:hypothetical protein
MHHLTLTLDAAVYGDHTCGYHRAAEPVEHLWPHHEIGDTRLVLEGDEHDTLGAARTLAHQHQPGCLEPAAIARLHGLGTGGEPKYPGLHALRHFYASWCINRRVDGRLELPLKVVQARLGHASIQMTADVYGHLFASQDDRKELAAAERALLTVPN